MKILNAALSFLGLGYLMFCIALAGVFSTFMIHPVLLLHPSYESKRASMGKENYQRYDAMDKEKFTLPVEGARLACQLVRNPANKGCVVMCHGLGCNLMEPVPTSYLFYDLGYSVLLYDARAFGKSTGKASTLGYLEKYDLSAVITEARRRLGPDTRIGVWGISFGAITAMLALDVDDRISFLVEDCGASEIKSFARQAFKTYSGIDPGLALPITERFYQWRLGITFDDIRPIDAVSKSNVPILFIHGTQDELIPCWMCGKLYLAANSPLSRIELFEGAGHGGSLISDPARYKRIINEFVRSVEAR